MTITTQDAFACRPSLIREGMLFMCGQDLLTQSLSPEVVGEKKKETGYVMKFDATDATDYL